MCHFNKKVPFPSSNPPKIGGKRKSENEGFLILSPLSPIPNTPNYLPPSFPFLPFPSLFPLLNIGLKWKERSP